MHLFRSYSRAVAVAILLLIGGCVAEHDKRPAPENFNPRTAVLMHQLKAALSRQAFGAVLALADSLEQYAPNLPDVSFARGLVYMERNQYDRAQAAFEHVLELDPNYRGAWYNLGQNAFLQRQYTEALDYYRKEQQLIAETGSRKDLAVSSTIVLQIGRTHEQLGHPDSARIAYERVLQMDSTVASAHGWLSKIYENEGNLEKALVHAGEALANDPANVKYTYRVGYLLFQMGKVEEAVPLLLKVVQQWPGHEGATYNLGRALIALGRVDEGQHYLDRLDEIRQLSDRMLRAQRHVEIYPNDPRGWTRLGNLMIQGGYLDKAYEAYRVALSLKPGSLVLHNDMGNLMLARGDTLRALRRYRAIIQKDSTFAGAWFNMGVVYAMMGRETAARRAWEKTLDLDPKHQQAQAYLARLGQ